jgi:hypothetical protein
LHDFLERCAWAHVPEATRRRLTDGRAAMAAKGVRQRDELVQLVDAFSRSEIQVLAFKGAVLSELVYSTPGIRDFRDLDLLVREADRERALALLRSMGYAIQPELSAVERDAFHRYHFAYTGKHPDRACVVDLHWRLLPSTWTIPLDHEALWNRSIEIQLGAGRLRTFGPEDTLFLQAVHGAKLRWPRLRLVRDFAQTAAAFQDLDWDATLERATRQRARRMFLLAAHLSIELCDAPVPSRVRAAIDGDRCVPELGRWVEARFASETYPGSEIFQLSGFRSRVLDGVIDKACYLARTFATPRVEHVRAFHLPAGLYFLSYPLKIVHDALLLPLWLGWKLLTRRSA